VNMNAWMRERSFKEFFWWRKKMKKGDFPLLTALRLMWRTWGFSYLLINSVSFSLIFLRKLGHIFISLLLNFIACELLLDVHLQKFSCFSLISPIWYVCSIYALRQLRKHRWISVTGCFHRIIGREWVIHGLWSCWWLSPRWE
jgi:hypothetical protein